jgi:hypothetical protein
MKFTNPELQKAFDYANDVLTNRIEYIDNMNNDIKKLEVFLQEHLGEIAFNYDIDVGIYLKFYKKFYIVNKYDKPAMQPLNQSKLSIRLLVYKSLPNFITELSEYIKSNYINNNKETPTC